MEGWLGVGQAAGDDAEGDDSAVKAVKARAATKQRTYKVEGGGVDSHKLSSDLHGCSGGTRLPTHI